MVIVYSSLIRGIAYALSSFDKILSISKNFTGSEKRNIKNALKALANAISKTVEHIEIKPQKYSDKEIATFWKEAGERLSLVPDMTQSTHWIFQKELYWRAGGSIRFINDIERIKIKSMLLLAEKLREKLE